MAENTLLHQLMTLPQVMQPLLSPNGRWVAFMWYRVHENIDVFLVPTDGTALPIALTHTPEMTVLNSWSPDSRSVVVSEDHNRDERSRLYRIDIDRPGLLVPLTEDRPSYFIRGGSLSPDGQLLYYAMNYDVGSGQETERTQVYRHNLTTGERKAIAFPRKPAYVLPALNSQGTQVLYNRRDLHPSGFQWWVVNTDGSGDREILNFGDQSKSFARWMPDGEHIAFRSDSKGRGPQQHQSLGLFHVPTGSLRWLIDNPERPVEGFWPSPDGSLVFDEVRRAGHRPGFIDLQTGVETYFPTMPGNLLPLGRAADGNWIAMHYSANSPEDLVRFDMSARGPEDLVSLTRVWQRTSVAREALAPAEDIYWQSVDGMEIHGWLYRAPVNAHKAILKVHGGPTSHSEDKLSAEIQYYVSRGFNVLDINYRGSTGHGLPFRDAIKVDGWGGREQADIATGSAALVNAGLAEAGRIGVTGTSYGGYSSWCMITGIAGGGDTSFLGAAVPICGMTDLVVDYDTTRPDLRPLSEEMMGGSPSENPQRYFERSPINFVQNIRGKLMIVQGAVDPNVTPANVREVTQRLDANGIQYELLVFEDEGHGILKPANQEKLYPRIADFFDRAFSRE